jgi:hypothetical protein
VRARRLDEGVRAWRGTNGVRARQRSERGREAEEGRGLVHLEAITERERERGGGIFFTLT